MFDVETVFVIATRRSSYVIEDILRSIAWSCQQAAYVIVIDRENKIKIPTDMSVGHTVLSPNNLDPTVSDAFARGVGIKWVIDKGITCKQYVGISDESLVLRQGFDTFLLSQLQKTSLGLVGVSDNMSYQAAFEHQVHFFEEWGLPHGNCTQHNNSDVLHDGMLAMSSELAMALFNSNLLQREDLGNWTLSYGAFVSWVSQMLGFYRVAWGRVNQQMPPLYVQDSKTGCLPAPHILSERFMFYHSLREVSAYSEEHIREVFKRQRGEPAKQPDPIRPLVSPPQPNLTVQG